MIITGTSLEWLREAVCFFPSFFLPKSLLRVTKQSRRRYNNKKTQISRLLSGVKSQLPNIGKRKEKKNREPRRNQFYRLQSIDKLSFPLQFFLLCFVFLLFAFCYPTSSDFPNKAAHRNDLHPPPRGKGCVNKTDRIKNHNNNLKRYTFLYVYIFTGSTSFTLPTFLFGGGASSHLALIN